MPAVRSTPIPENGVYQIAIDAFPTLFPTGKADFNAPRGQKMSMEEWAAHLMHYEDGRFARHPRFRYWALNTIFRHRAKEASRWYAKSHPEDGALSIEEIREMINENNVAGLAQRVSRAAAPIEGSRPFWTTQRRNLNCQIRDLGCPSVFFSCSAADIQWPDLHQHMPGYTGDNEPDGPEAYRTRWSDLNNNPG
jgi:hypothetical protein